MVAFKVFLGNKEIDKVFYGDEKTTRDEVYRSLVEHDGYNPEIRVFKEMKGRN